MNFDIKRDKKWAKIGIVLSLLFIVRKTFTVPKANEILGRSWLSEPWITYFKNWDQVPLQFQCEIILLIVAVLIMCPLFFVLLSWVVGIFYEKKTPL